jgi:hypothetical protein
MPPPFPAGPPGLSPEHFAQLAEARRRSKKIRRAAAVATFDGWATGVFGALTFLVGLIAFSWVGLALGAAMLVVAWVEFRGARQLRQLDPAAANSLAINQLFLGAALLTYAMFSLWTVFHSQTFITQQLANSPELSQAGLGSIESLAKMLGLLIYGTLAAVAIFGQGGTALYYATRRKHVEAYRRETPQWILDAQRAGMPM